MITKSEDATKGVLTPEINPRLSVQFGPHEEQVEVVFTNTERIGGGRVTPAEPGLNANASDSPASGLIP